MSAPRAEIISAPEMNLDAFCRLQRAAFGQILRAAGVADSYMTPDFYRWKYRPPAGPARIAVVRRGSELDAAVAMFPLRVRHQGDAVPAWQVCDVATDPAVRGRGLFRACVSALRDFVGEDELFLGFPNRYSRPVFADIGWRPMATLTTWAGVALGGGVSAPPGIEEVSVAGSTFDRFGTQLGNTPSAIFERSADYLNWRYLDHPIHDYTLLVHRSAGVLSGFSVLRPALVRGHHLTLLMEVWSTSATEHREMLRAIRARARQSESAWLAAPTSGIAAGWQLGGGLVPLPGVLLPRKPVLMGIGTGARSRAALSAPWCLRTGDWDAF